MSTCIYEASETHFFATLWEIFHFPQKFSDESSPLWWLKTKGLHIQLNCQSIPIFWSIFLYNFEFREKITKSPICIYPDSPVVNILPNFLYYLCSHTYFLMFLLIFENKCEWLCPFTPKILQCLFPKRENVLFFLNENVLYLTTVQLSKSKF